ncbi:cell wall anchor protein [Plantactinospora siamensis]|uniref:Cell wall anchor protein n=1 Tax=Plantactinospora siamensis TaxID=555372 RepID=A0ABV6NRR9_9ACTN
MTFRNRPLARLGAAALLASGAFTALGTPAFAEGAKTDLSIDVAGTRVAAGAEGKVGFVKLGNKGDTTPTDVKILVDLSKLDQDTAEVAVLGQSCAEDPAKHVWTCSLTAEEIPAPGATVDLPLISAKKDPAKSAPYSAPVTFTVVTPEDDDKSNNSKTATVEFADKGGVDLGVLVPDVSSQLSWVDGDIKEQKPVLNPGDETTVVAALFNQGDQIAAGVGLKLTLPKGVTLSQNLEDCAISADRRSADCQDSEIQINPQDDLYGVFKVKVAADLKAPVTLSGGNVTVAALGAADPTAKRLAKSATTKLPSYLTNDRPAGVPTDIDPSDNSDGFSVLLAAVGNGGAGGGEGDDDGGLPVTGPQAGLIGGVGAAVLAAGGVLFMMARRRRVVLVVPGDEKPSA